MGSAQIPDAPTATSPQRTPSPARSLFHQLVHATPAVTLLDEPGIGVVTAAIAMTAGPTSAGCAPRLRSHLSQASTRCLHPPTKPPDIDSVAAATDA